MQENNSQVTQLPSNSVIQAEQTPKSNFLVILLSILLFLSVSIAGFFAYQTQKLVKELNNLKSDEKIVSEVTPEPTADPTANWKTYTNTQYNFLFKYPTYLEDKGGISGPYTGTNIAIRSFADSKTMAEGTDMPFDGYALYYFRY